MTCMYTKHYTYTHAFLLKSPTKHSVPDDQCSTQQKKQSVALLSPDKCTFWFQFSSKSYPGNITLKPLSPLTGWEMERVESKCVEPGEKETKVWGAFLLPPPPLKDSLWRREFKPDIIFYLYQTILPTIVFINTVWISS